MGQDIGSILERLLLILLFCFVVGKRGRNNGILQELKTIGTKLGAGTMNTETILKQTTSFRDDLLNDLTDTKLAMYYLESALADYMEDGNMESIWMALRDVVEAQGAVSELSKRTDIDAETLSDTFSKEDTPRLEMLSTILKSFGCELPAKLSADVNETYSRTPTNP